MTSYTLYPNLALLLGELPTDSIVSRSLLKSDATNAVLFGFAAGQELSEHTSSYPAILHFLAGQAQITLGEDVTTAQAGTWVYMPPRLPHRIYAETAVTMLLLLLK